MARIRLGGSGDLTNWIVAGFGVVMNGVATVDVIENNQMLFYRAVVDGP